MRTSEQINEVASSLNKLQAEMRPALKEKTNSHLKTSYADLYSIWEVIRDPLTNNGLSLLQDLSVDEHGVGATTRIMHVTGQWIEFGPLVFPALKKDPHSIAALCTYAKRYSLSAALGVVGTDEDDDGEKAMKHYREAEQQQKLEASKPLPPQMISVWECVKLEEMLADDQEFRTRILDALSQKNGKKFEDFFSITVAEYNNIVKKIMKAKDYHKSVDQIIAEKEAENG